MADTSRFPEGVLLQSSTSVARPVGTLVLASDGILYRSTNATVATYVPVGALTPGLGSRVLYTSGALVSTVNAGTGAALQNFGTVYTVPASTIGAGDLLRVTYGGSFVRVADFDFVLSLTVQGVNRGAINAVTVTASGTWSVEMVMTTDSGGAGTNARSVTTFLTAIGSAAGDAVPFIDDQGYTFASTGLIQLQASLSGGNAGNTATCRLMGVELIKASA